MVDLSGSNDQFISDVQELEDDAIATLALVDEPTAEWTAQALRIGVKAILPRDSSAEDIVSAIHAAHRGLVLLDAEIAGELIHSVRAASPLRQDAVEELTPREIEVLRMMAEGLANKEIAVRLNISDHTVKFHISSILGKLGVSSRTEAVTQGIRMGLILL
jgi:DNA-binding NarL/FixJ family response regulator